MVGKHCGPRFAPPPGLSFAADASVSPASGFATGAKSASVAGSAEVSSEPATDCLVIKALQTQTGAIQ